MKIKNKTKYFLCLVVLFFASSGLLDEYLHNFSEIKWLYASIHPDKYFEKDAIVYEEKLPGGSRSKGLDIYFYSGPLKKNEGKKRVLNNEDSMDDLWISTGFPDVQLEIPVWYNKMDGAVAIRRSESTPTPYSAMQLEAYTNIFTWLLFFPAIIYITRYQIQKRKKKSSSNNT